MAEPELTERVKALEVEMRTMREFRAEMKASVGDVRREVAEVREMVGHALSDLKDQLRDVVINSLNSMPQWAAKSNVTAWAMVGALAGITAALLGAFFYLHR